MACPGPGKRGWGKRACYGGKGRIMAYNNGSLTTQQVKDMQAWYGTTTDGKWGSGSSAAAGGRNAGAAYSLYSSNYKKYSSYSAYSSGRTGGSSSGGSTGSGLTAGQIREMQSWYGTTADGVWGKNSTAAASGMGVNSAYEMYKNNRGKYSSYGEMKNAKNNGSTGYTPGGTSAAGSSAANPNYTGGSTGRPSSSSGGSGGGSGGSAGGTGTAAPSYDNGGLSPEQIRELQSYYGVAADGKWGKNSSTAAGGMSAADAWNRYQESMTAPDAGYDAGYDTGYDSGYDHSGPMSYSDYLARVGGEDYQAAVQKAIEAQVQAAADQYNSQIESAGQDYEEAARRAYVSKMMSQRNMDQELAANGIYGGMADSQRIAAETNYENNLNDLTQQYQSTISDLRQAITSAQLAGDAQSAQAMADYLSQVQAQYASYLQNERSIQAEIDMFNRQLAAQRAQEARAAAASSGSSGSGGYSGGESGGSGYSAKTANLQRELNAMGANLTVDGIMGPETQAAYDQLIVSQLPDLGTIAGKAALSALRR